MKIRKFKTEEEWMENRKGRITGTRLGSLALKSGKGYKIGFYELVADGLAIEPDGENRMERGKRLECEAIEELSKALNKEFINGTDDYVIWESDEDSRISLSPDAYTKDLKIAGEAKCLSPARHLEAYLTQTIPSEYEGQKIQYFIVNPDLQKLYFAFYDPRVLVLPFFYIEVKRADFQDEIDRYRELEKKALKESHDIILKLSKF